jgi:hypothetical protein
LCNAQSRRARENPRNRRQFAPNQEFTSAHHRHARSRKFKIMHNFAQNAQRTWSHFRTPESNMIWMTFAAGRDRPVDELAYETKSDAQRLGAPQKMKIGGRAVDVPPMRNEPNEVAENKPRRPNMAGCFRKNPIPCSMRPAHRRAVAPAGSALCNAQSRRARENPRNRRQFAPNQKFTSAHHGHARSRKFKIMHNFAQSSRNCETNPVPFSNTNPSSGLGTLR